MSGHLFAVKILAISGSLRAVSINSAFLRAAARIAPAGVVVEVFPSLGELPLFNPDLESSPPDSVVDFRSRVAEADALLIATPEYAHGITGVMKNALDWLVSFEPFAYKPVSVVNTSPTAHHADAALREILRTMSANLVGEASATIPLLGSRLDEEGMVAAPWVVEAIQEVLRELCEAAKHPMISLGASFPLG
ncbi:MAG: NADPH-dependent reductase [Akkermansiaceae bacterium]|nr:NADPH-dependent reductase [Akkermansiaceae bacterium]